MARVGAVVALGAATLVILRPFLVPLAWAAILAYVTWPVYRRVRAHTRRPRLAATLFTLGVVVGIGVPVALLLLALADDASALVQAFRDWREQGAQLPAWLPESEWLARGLERLQAATVGDPAFAGDWLGRAGAELSRQLVALASGVARNVFKFGVTILALYFFYLGGEAILEVARPLAALLFPTAPERFLERIGASVQAVVFGLLGTALVQGSLAAVGLAVAGVPSPVALGAATALLSFLPGGGSALSLLAAAWLGFSGHVLAAFALAVWTLLVVSSVDNVLRPILISGRAQIPFLLVFFGVLGGLAAFGVVGLFLGPVILSVAFTLLVEFSRTRAAA